jgi:hypothetical protein
MCFRVMGRKLIKGPCGPNRNGNNSWISSLGGMTGKLRPSYPLGAGTGLPDAP